MSMYRIQLHVYYPLGIFRPLIFGMASYKCV
nr:MAG TPA: hypothetical protein [Caudoviricetes sp.]